LAILGTMPAGPHSLGLRGTANIRYDRGQRANRSAGESSDRRLQKPGNSQAGRFRDPPRWHVRVIRSPVPKASPPYAPLSAVWLLLGALGFDPATIA
jgi:hypothetical protein